jgi:general nucleoside transport system permease protein
MSETAVVQQVVHPPARLGGVGGTLVRAIGPVVLALVVAGILLLALGRNPVTFYGDVLDRGLLSWSGLQESIIRMAPLLLLAAGLIVAFRANVWNLGVDGQFLLGAAMAAGLGVTAVDALGEGVALPLVCVVAAVVGAAWTIVPAFLKARYGVNEIISSLMMTFIGINLANILVKGPFLQPEGGVPRTEVLPVESRLPTLPGTRIHVGIIIGLVAVLAVHYVMTRTPLGLRLNVLGANPRAAVHLGLGVGALTVVAFLLSGALIGLAGAVEILGVWGTFRADWDPAFGLLVVPLVFLARFNGIAVIGFVAFFAVLSIGGEFATRQADLPKDFLLVLVGLMLLFMAVTEYLGTRRALGQSYLTSGLASALRRRRHE